MRTGDAQTGPVSNGATEQGGSFTAAKLAGPIASTITAGQAVAAASETTQIDASHASCHRLSDPDLEDYSAGTGAACIDLYQCISRAAWCTDSQYSPTAAWIPLKNLFDRVFRYGSSASPWHSGEPVRAELFSVERLEEHARSLAIAQAVTPKPTKGHPLAGRLADNSAVLLHAYRVIAKAIDERRAITPAAEWLVDNYYLVERQISEIRSALPPGYYRQLPKLADGPFTGYPRVFGLAWAFVAHTDSHFDTEMLCRFVHAYQEVQPLTIGELWAVAITLRIVLIENLRRLAELIVHSSEARHEADGLADRLLGAGGRTAESCVGCARQA